MRSGPTTPSALNLRFVLTVFDIYIIYCILTYNLTTLLICRSHSTWGDALGRDQAAGHSASAVRSTIASASATCAPRIRSLFLSLLRDGFFAVRARCLWAELVQLCAALVEICAALVPTVHARVRVTLFVFHIIAFPFFLWCGKCSSCLSTSYIAPPRPPTGIRAHPKHAIVRNRYNVAVGVPAEFHLLNPKNASQTVEGTDFVVVENAAGVDALQRMLAGTRPGGGTPLAERLELIQNRLARRHPWHGNIFLVIVTDGVPTPLEWTGNSKHDREVSKCHVSKCSNERSLTACLAHCLPVYHVAFCMPASLPSACVPLCPLHACLVAYTCLHLPAYLLACLPGSIHTAVSR